MPVATMPCKLHSGSFICMHKIQAWSPLAVGNPINTLEGRGFFGTGVWGVTTPAHLLGRGPVECWSLQGRDASVQSIIWSLGATTRYSLLRHSECHDAVISQHDTPSLRGLPLTNACAFASL